MLLPFDVTLRNIWVAATAITHYEQRIEVYEGQEFNYTSMFVFIFVSAKFISILLDNISFLKFKEKEEEKGQKR